MPAGQERAGGSPPAVHDVSSTYRTTLHNNRGQGPISFRTLKGGCPPIPEAMSNPEGSWTYT